MPYKDPERKRQWEREHREQRNARRSALRLEQEARVIANPGPTQAKEMEDGWQTILGLAVGLGFALVAAFRGIQSHSQPETCGR